MQIASTPSLPVGEITRAFLSFMVLMKVKSYSPVLNVGNHTGRNQCERIAQRALTTPSKPGL